MNPFMRFFPETLQANLLYNGSGPASPKEWETIYRTKNILGAITRDAKDVPGYVVAAAQWEMEDFLASKDVPVYEDSLYYTQTSTLALLHTPYKTYIQENILNLEGNQLTGDCTSWMVRAMLDLTRLQRMSTGEQEQFILRTSTVPYYANRGHRGEGSNPTRQCRYATEIGYVLEQAYGRYDFTNYKDSYRLGMSWGTSRIPTEISDVTKQYGPGELLVIRSLEGLLDAQRKKYPIGLGSSMAVRSTGNPISTFSGSWNHAMGHVGHDQTEECRDQFGDNVTFIDQSWGNWNTVTNIPERWKPWGQGMFAVLTRKLEPYISRGECLCYVPENASGIPTHPIFL